jgi:hypothetical protein
MSEAELTERVKLAVLRDVEPLVNGLIARQVQKALLGFAFMNGLGGETDLPLLAQCVADAKREDPLLPREALQARAQAIYEQRKSDGLPKRS